MPGPYKLDERIWEHVCDTFRLGEVFTISAVVESLPTHLRALSNIDSRVRDTLHAVLSQPIEKLDGHIPLKRVDSRHWTL